MLEVSYCYTIFKLVSAGGRHRLVGIFNDVITIHLYNCWYLCAYLLALRPPMYGRWVTFINEYSTVEWVLLTEVKLVG
jgi:hypothetical protein